MSAVTPPIELTISIGALLSLNGGNCGSALESTNLFTISRCAARYSGELTRDSSVLRQSPLALDKLLKTALPTKSTTQATLFLEIMGFASYHHQAPSLSCANHCAHSGASFQLGLLINDPHTQTKVFPCLETHVALTRHTS